MAETKVPIEENTKKVWTEEAPTLTEVPEFSESAMVRVNVAAQEKVEDGSDVARQAFEFFDNYTNNPEFHDVINLAAVGTGAIETRYQQFRTDVEVVRVLPPPSPEVSTPAPEPIKVNVKRKVEKLVEEKPTVEPEAKTTRRKKIVSKVIDPVVEPDTRPDLEALAKAQVPSQEPQPNIEANIPAQAEVTPAAPSAEPFEVVDDTEKQKLEQDTSQDLEKLAKAFEATQKKEGEKKQEKTGGPKKPEKSKKGEEGAELSANDRNFYDTLRKIPILKHYADRWEAENGLKRANELSLDLAHVETDIDQKTREMKNMTDEADKTKAMEFIKKLEGNHAWLSGEMASYERRRDRAAEAAQEKINTKLRIPEERIHQIEESIRLFQHQMDEHREYIEAKGRERDELAPYMNDSGKRSFERLIKAARNESDAIKRKLTTLVIEANNLGISVRSIQTTAKVFDMMKIPRPSESRISEFSSPESSPEKNTLSVDNAVTVWNTRAERYNRINGNDTPLPEIEAKTFDEYKDIIDEIKKELPDDQKNSIDERNISPEAFKLFVQKYAEKTNKPLTMSRIGQRDFNNVLEQVMTELDVAADDSLYAYDKTLEKKKVKNKKDVIGKIEPYDVASDKKEAA
jgi:hypothetical protein